MLRGERLVRAAGFDERRVAVLIAEVELAVAIDRRGGEFAADPLAPHDFARGSVDRRGDAVVAEHVDQAVDQNRRGRLGDVLRESPDDVRIRDVALAVGSHGPQLRMHQTGDQVRDAVLIERPRRDRPIVEVDAPDFLAGRRLVAEGRLGAAAQQLLLAVRTGHQERRAMRLPHVAIFGELAGRVFIVPRDVAIGLPNRLAGRLVEGGQDTADRLRRT